MIETAMQDTPPPAKTARQPRKTALPEKAVATEEIKLPVSAPLLEMLAQYRKERGNIATAQVIDAALKKARAAYESALGGVFEKDEEFQLSLLEKEEKKAKGAAK